MLRSRHHSLSAGCQRCFHRCFVNIHIFSAVHRNTLCVFWRKKRSAVQHIHNPNQRQQPHRPNSHSRKERSPQVQTEAQQADTPKTQRKPNTLHLRNGTEVIENVAGHTIQTPSFDLNPFPFSFHFFFPTFAFFSFGPPRSACSSPPLYSPQPTAEKVFFMHSRVFTEQVSVFFGQGSSAMSHNPF